MESIVLQRRRAATGDGGALAALAEICEDCKEPSSSDESTSTSLHKRTVSDASSLSVPSTTIHHHPHSSSSYITVMAGPPHPPPPSSDGTITNTTTDPTTTTATPTPVTPVGNANVAASSQNQNMVHEILSASMSLAELSKSPVVFQTTSYNKKYPKVPRRASKTIPFSVSTTSASSTSSAAVVLSKKAVTVPPLMSSIFQPRIEPRTDTKVLSQSTSTTTRNHFPRANTTKNARVAIPMAKGASSHAARTTASFASTKSNLAAAANTSSTNAERFRFRQYQVTTWSQRLEEVQAFVRKHGHCMIPSDYPPNQKLAKWAKRQRCQYQLFQSNPSKSSMTSERIRVLEDLGFCWQNKMSVWQARYEELLQFHLQFGHTQVPSSYKPNQRLATWVKCQRRQKRLRDRGKPSSMTDDRIALLDSVNFVWRMYPSNPRDS